MTKRWYESTAVWGGIVAIISVALQLLGKSISPDDQNNLAQQLALIGSAAGGVLAIVGRIKAVVPMAGSVTQLLESATGNRLIPMAASVPGEELPSFVRTQAGCVSTDPPSQTVKPESQTS